MQQYFVDTKLNINEKIEMNNEQSHHIAHVMRMHQNEMIRLADCNANMYFAHVEFEDHKVFAVVDSTIEDHTKTKVEIHLLQGMIKGDKWDYLLQKSAELGVTSIYPFTSSRSVVKTKDEKVDKKMLRWQKILQEACEQSKRSTLVKLYSPMRLSEVCDIEADIKLIAYEDADHKAERLCDILKEHPNVHSAAIMIGCEGGFSLEEVEEMQKHGFLRVSLGARILRAETAALSMLNSLSFYYEMAGDPDEKCLFDSE